MVFLQLEPLALKIPVKQTQRYTSLQVCFQGKPSATALLTFSDGTRKGGLLRCPSRGSESEFDCSGTLGTGVRLRAEHHPSFAVCFLGRPRGHAGKGAPWGTARGGAVTQVIAAGGGAFLCGSGSRGNVDVTPEG